MKHYLSDRINNMATSATLAMAAKARELRNEGKDIIGLSLGEPDFNIPDFIKEEAKKRSRPKLQSLYACRWLCRIKTSHCH